MESLSVKKKRLFKKQNKSKSKKDKNREEFSYIGSSPTVKYKNDGYSKVEIINSVVGLSFTFIVRTFFLSFSSK
jgi:hypothetical protein